MTAEQFAYWLQGFAELSPTPPTQEQWDLIKAHLELQFKKVTPPLALPQTDKNLLDKMKEAAKKQQPSTIWDTTEFYKVTC